MYSVPNIKRISSVNTRSLAYSVGHMSLQEQCDREGRKYDANEVTGNRTQDAAAVDGWGGWGNEDEECCGGSKYLII